MDWFGTEYQCTKARNYYSKYHYNKLFKVVLRCGVAYPSFNLERKRRERQTIDSISYYLASAQKGQVTEVRRVVFIAKSLVPHIQVSKRRNFNFGRSTQLDTFVYFCLSKYPTI